MMATFSTNRDEDLFAADSQNQILSRSHVCRIIIENSVQNGTRWSVGKTFLFTFPSDGNSFSHDTGIIMLRFFNDLLV